MARNGKVIISKEINLDNTYSNVLNYSESDMLSLMTSQSHLMYQNDTYSFLREQDNQIDVEVPYSVCLQSNYLAFQNPNYSSKWFFAFIKDVKMTSEKNTTIYYEIDVFTTWFNSLTVKPCFVQREHVNDDTVGLHTVPEGLETGDYIVGTSGVLDLNPSVFEEQSIVMAVTLDPDFFPDIYTVYYGGCYSGTVYIEFSGVNLGQAGIFIKALNHLGKLDLITSIFMLPTFTLDVTGYQFSLGSVTVTCNLVDSTQDAFEYSIPIGNKPTTLGSYTPKNKKLLTGDYNFLLLDNGSGGVKKYNYEYFNTSGTQGLLYFDHISSPSPSGSVMYAPRYYKNKTQNLVESFAGAKFPMCSWASDPYTNWLTQSGINRAFGYGKDLGQILLGTGALALGGVNPAIGAYGATQLGLGIGSALNDITNNVQQKKEHQIAPNELSGNESLGDVAFAHFRCIPKYYQMHIREEYCKIIDDFFSRFGYQINRVKTPNITGRTYWNYVKIGAGEDIGNGNIPNKFKDTLNQIFINGTTIWHSHDNIGNFNLNNTIVS